MRKEYRLKTPLSKEDVLKLGLGDLVYITGAFFTASHGAHMRILLDNVPSPVNTDEVNVMLHSHLLVRKVGDWWQVVCGGPTTSTKLDVFGPEIIPRLKLRAIVGKGGMGELTTDAMKEHGCVYLCSLGGESASVYGQSFKRVKEVHWLDLGRPDAMWVIEVENWGPFIVGIDAHGNNLFDRINEDLGKSISMAYKTIE